MEIDFKHYRYKRPSEIRKKRKKNFIIIIVLIIGLSLIIWDQISSYYLILGEKLILNENYKQAEETLIKALSLKRRKAEIYDALGVCYLFQDKEEAVNYFKKALNKGIKKSSLNWEKILEKLISKGKYNLSETYIDYLKKWLNPRDLIFYETTVFLANHDFEKAEKNINTYSKEILKKFERRIKLQKKILNNLRNKKIFYFMFDRRHTPLYGINLKGNIISANSNPPVFNWKEFSKEDFKNQIILTINSRIQDSARKALGKYNGCIIAINPKTGEILAAVSKDNNKNYLNSCFQKLYEPGSIIKILTACAFLKEKNKRIFPFSCKGVDRIGGKAFYDWISHGRVETLSEALIFSCNLAFARIGLSLGWGKIKGIFRDFLFHNGINIKGIPLNTPEIPEKINNEWELARLSIGLDELKITPFHAVLIASVIANRGILMKPFIIKEKRNIFGIPYLKNFPKEIKRIIPEDTNYILRDAMIKAVEEGTGRRAKIKGIKIALKTGTAGEKRKGYNSILIGFAPAHNPKIAFSIFAEGAGRADIEGAKITKKLLESILEELK
ncbi:penicillin-binding transpeptidase domain-containing protein [Candidatus Aminicenantes bacterium AC-335-K20]|jgi:peptidoglycan glycosyltransferase|nr:penicillin-binding transpeptidase domain-containing protein [SCandidatus Aminicenantes bacterium Aminicenantia_JdfR_composite]MCP2619190.1 penicillin-binding transpeptidase domain-containing protein [Candidatus Aminicenantes bacterium AC-335-K20]MCP2620944.1 penicillin-binding transpeptidase domain-containing protein [Candidatus Aminicenantes bacterium AC-334-E05]